MLDKKSHKKIKFLKMRGPKIEIEFDGQDIDTILDTTKRYLVENEKNLIKIRVNSKLDSKTMLEYGFILSSALFPPTYLTYELDELATRYMDKLNENEMDFWGIHFFYFKYISNGEYIYANIEGWKQHALEEAISLPLFLFAPDLLYRSNRPITDMSMFRQPTSILYTDTVAPTGPSLDKFSRGIITTSNDIVSGIPVTRYAPGMSKGLYFDKEKDRTNFCGVFYYYEPESTTYLTYSTYRIYRNKYEAIRKLYKEFNINKYIRSIDRHEEYFKNRQKNPGKFPDDLRMTPLEFVNFFPEKVHSYDYTKSRYKSLTEYAGTLPNRKYYIGKIIDLYAEEDIYDQDICKTAALHGIDIVIFTHMAGSNQVVTEVLDTRERLRSFDNLAYFIS